MSPQTPWATVKMRSANQSNPSRAAGLPSGGHLESLSGEGTHVPTHRLRKKAAAQTESDHLIPTCALRDDLPNLPKFQRRASAWRPCPTVAHSRDSRHRPGCAEKSFTMPSRDTSKRERRDGSSVGGLARDARKLVEELVKVALQVAANVFQKPRADSLLHDLAATPKI